MTPFNEPEILETIFNFEMTLLNPATRGNAAEIGALLDAHFFEIGCSGKTWARNEVIDALTKEKPRDISITGFNVHRLGEEIILVTYCAASTAADGSVSQTKRSSIWRNSAGRWQMAFHQGTSLFHP